MEGGNGGGVTEGRQGWRSGYLVVSAKGSKEVRRWGDQGRWNFSEQKGLPKIISTWVWTSSRWKRGDTLYYICLDRRRRFKSRKRQDQEIRVKWRNLLPCKRENVKKEEVGDTQKEKWFHSFPSFASVYFQCLSRNCDEALVSLLLKLSHTLWNGLRREDNFLNRKYSHFILKSLYLFFLKIIYIYTYIYIFFFFLTCWAT